MTPNAIQMLRRLVTVFAEKHRTPHEDNIYQTALATIEQWEEEIETEISH